tara:strand:+ start:171 stop:404 length:234 start_codon:yes stop_codon:yes gene_type:complete
MSKEMELIIRGKDIYGLSKTKTQMIKCLNQEIEYILNLPEEATIENGGDDYITFYVNPKDKDDRKHYKSLGFMRSEV